MKDVIQRLVQSFILRTPWIHGSVVRRAVLSSSVRASVLSFAFIWGFSSPAAAEAITIRGLVHKPSTNKSTGNKNAAANEATSILIKGHRTPFKVKALNGDAAQALLPLKHGDLIVARGTLDLPSHQVLVQSIESVGLKALLGTWRTPLWRIFEFKDFTQLNLYAPMTNGSVLSLEKTAEYNYVLAPERSDRYTIFLSGQNSVLLGSITFDQDSVEMRVLDANTGVVLENITLSPLPLQ